MQFGQLHSTIWTNTSCEGETWENWNTQNQEQALESLCNKEKYNYRFGQIYCTIWTNILYNLDKCISWGQTKMGSFEHTKPGTGIRIRTSQKKQALTCQQVFKLLDQWLWQSDICTCTWLVWSKFHTLNRSENLTLMGPTLPYPSTMNSSELPP